LIFAQRESFPPRAVGILRDHPKPGWICHSRADPGCKPDRIARRDEESRFAVADNLWNSA